MSSLIWSTTRYETTDLTGAGPNYYSLGDNLYIHKTTLKVTNKSANAATLTSTNVVAVVQEVPTIATDGSRLVMRCTATDATQQDSLRLLFDVTEL